MKKITNSKIFIYFILWGILSFISIKFKEFILNVNLKNDFFNLIKPIFSFYEVHNTGAAFSLFKNNINILIFCAVVFIIIFTALVLAKSSKFSTGMICSMSSLSAGMTINTFERINDGYVTDYIYFSFWENFPVFNISDILIVIGAFSLAFSLVVKSRN